MVKKLNKAVVESVKLTYDDVKKCHDFFSEFMDGSYFCCIMRKDNSRVYLEDVLSLESGLYIDNTFEDSDYIPTIDELVDNSKGTLKSLKFGESVVSVSGYKDSNWRFLGYVSSIFTSLECIDVFYDYILDNYKIDIIEDMENIIYNLYCNSSVLLEIKKGDDTYIIFISSVSISRHTCTNNVLGVSKGTLGKVNDFNIRVVSIDTSYDFMSGFRNYCPCCIAGALGLSSSEVERVSVLYS